MADLLRLHVGCGDVYLPAFVNIDIREDCGADRICDARWLPFDDGSAEEVVALDFLEHFPKTETAQILGEWWRVLAVGGRLEVRVPNLQALATQISYYGDKEGPQLELLIDNLMGGHKFGPDGAWDTHHWGWTPYSLAKELRTSGFEVLSNDLCLNMTVIATKA